MARRMPPAVRSMARRQAVAVTEYAVLAAGIVIACMAALNAFGFGDILDRL
jgi:hypothetical protein